MILEQCKCNQIKIIQVKRKTKQEKVISHLINGIPLKDKLQSYINLPESKRLIIKKPISGKRSEEQTLERKEYAIVQCGKCPYCKLYKVNQWKARFKYEMINNEGMFIHLTYKNEPTSQGNNLHLMQKFTKRLYKKFNLTGKTTKVLKSGEYGDAKGRIHGHMLISGFKVNDLQYAGKSNRGHIMYSSKILTKQWKHGRVRIQDFTNEAIGYALNYTEKLRKYNKQYDIDNSKGAYTELINLRNVKRKLKAKQIYAKSKYTDKYITCQAKINEIQKKIKQLEKHLRNIRMREFTTYSKNIGFTKFIQSDFLKKFDTLPKNSNIPLYWIYKSIDYENYTDCKNINEYNRKKINALHILQEIKTQSDRKVKENLNLINKLLKENKLEQYETDSAFIICAKRSDDIKIDLYEDISNVLNNISRNNDINWTQAHIAKSKAFRKVNAIDNNIDDISININTS